MWFFCESVDLTKITSPGQIVALGPLAEYLLSKHNVEHIYLSTPFAEDKLYEGREQYFYRQLEWIDCFEKWLTNKLSCFGIVNPGLIHAHYYQLVFLVDSLHIHSTVLNNFVQSCRPDKVTYLRNNEQAITYSPYELHKYGNRLIQDIAMEIFRINGIDFNFLETEASNISDFDLFSEKVIETIKKTSRLFGTKPLYEFFKYKKINRLLNFGEHINKNFLVLNAGVASIDIVMRELVKQANAVYFKDQESIHEMHHFLSRKCFSFNRINPKARFVSNAFKKIAEDIMASDEVFVWLDRVSCSVGRRVLAPYFKYFISKICPRNILEVEEISLFLKEKNIDFLVSRSSSEDFVISSLIAAKEQKVKRVVFQHGMSPLDWKSWHITELKMNDVYFTSDTISYDYFKEALKNDYTGKCQISLSSHYLKFLNTLVVNNIANNTLIVYVPMRGFWGFRCLNNMRYPLTWYFKLEQALVDLLGQNKKAKVIFKIGSGQSWAEESIIQYIKNSGYKNIEIRRDDFIAYINSGAKILTDYPSSALFEAAAAKLPVMSLCYSKLPLWPEAKQTFGNSIQLFSSFDEAVEKSKAFIMSMPDEYVVKDFKIDRESNFMDSLLSLRQ